MFAQLFHLLLGVSVCYTLSSCRVFQECLTYEGEMDYKTYLDFILALENRKTPQALQYLFKILDCEGEGALTVFSLNYFFRAVQEELSRHGQDVVSGVWFGSLCVVVSL